MKKIFFTPGPSQLYPTVPGHIKTALDEGILSISHRGDTFHTIVESTQNNLRKLLGVPKTHYIFFLSSATEIMERIIENVVAEKSLHFVNGSFSKLFYDVATKLGKKTSKIEMGLGEGFDFTKMYTLPKTELICITQNETSTGVAIPMEDVYALKKKLLKETLLALDIVSSAPYPHLQFSKLDLVFFSVQKGFGLPAGLGILIVSPKAYKKAQYLAKEGSLRGSYHTFENLMKYNEKKETPETPNVFAIYLLGKVCQDFLKVGIDHIRKDTKEKSDMISSTVTHNNKLTFFVSENRFRSNTVLVLNVKGGSKGLLEKLRSRGFIVGSGYRDLKEKQIRIANFPAHSRKNMQKMLQLLHEY